MKTDTDENSDGIKARRRGFGLLELSILAAAVCVSGAIITLAIVGAAAG